MSAIKIKKNLGFTLIEMLIVSMLSALLLLTITSVFMTFLISNTKTSARKEIKASGSHALARIEFLIRGAEEIVGSCDNGNSSEIIFKDPDGFNYEIDISGDKLAVILADGEIREYLTTDDLTVTNLSFSCSSRSDDALVKAGFSLEKDTPEGLITESFSVTTSLRN